MTKRLSKRGSGQWTYKESQIEKVLAEIEEQQNINQNQPSEEIEQPGAHEPADESQSTTGATENVDSTETAEDADSSLPEIVVTGESETPDAPYRMKQDEKLLHVDTQDTGKLLMRFPGTNVSSNDGPLTGIPQRRGQSYTQAAALMSWWTECTLHLQGRNLWTRRFQRFRPMRLIPLR